MFDVHLSSSSCYYTFSSFSFIFYLYFRFSPLSSSFPPLHSLSLLNNRTIGWQPIYHRCRYCRCRSSIFIYAERRKKVRDSNCGWACMRDFNRIYRGLRAVARKHIMHPFYSTSLVAPLLVSLLSSPRHIFVDSLYFLLPTTSAIICFRFFT